MQVDRAAPPAFPACDFAFFAGRGLEKASADEYLEGRLG
jgi:hypothetical protein